MEITMAEDRSNNTVPIGTAQAPKQATGGAEEVYQLLRRLGSIGYQVRATTVAGDRYLTQDSQDDRDTGVWLISCAVALAEELTTEIDGLARNLRPRPGDASFGTALQGVRTRAHQLFAATRAADHFLDQETTEDKSTGSWLVACAHGLADKLTTELEDLANGLKRAAGEAQQAAVDAAAARRGAAGVRGAA